MNVYEALRETFDVPDGDLFATVTEHKPEDFIYDRQFFDIVRSDDFVVVQVTVPDRRPEKGPVPADRGAPLRSVGRAPRGRLHQSRRGGEGELVLRAWHRATRMTDIL